MDAHDRADDGLIARAASSATLEERFTSDRKQRDS
jgi:hypothetical protein